MVGDMATAMVETVVHLEQAMAMRAMAVSLVVVVVVVMRGKVPSLVGTVEEVVVKVGDKSQRVADRPVGQVVLLLEAAAQYASHCAQCTYDRAVAVPRCIRAIRK